MTGSEAAASPATQLRVGASTPPNRVGCSSEVAVVSARSPGLDCGPPVVSATGCWDSLFFSARSASRSQTSDILIRLTLVSGSQLLRAISAQCAACSRYAATFSLPDIQSPIRLSTRSLKLRHRNLVPHCTRLTGKCSIFKRRGPGPGCRGIGIRGHQRLPGGWDRPGALTAALISLTKNLIIRHQLIHRDQEVLRPLDVVAFQFIFLDQIDLCRD